MNSSSPPHHNIPKNNIDLLISQWFWIPHWRHYCWYFQNENIFALLLLLCDRLFWFMFYFFFHFFFQFYELLYSHWFYFIQFSLNIFTRTFLTIVAFLIIVYCYLWVFDFCFHLVIIIFHLLVVLFEFYLIFYLTIEHTQLL